ncbi:MAG: methanethiol S-methyltransferase [Pseudomonadota bacterium]
MNRIIPFLYGVLCYAIFFLTFLYLIGFVSNQFVPRSIDVGPATDPGIALLINIGLLALFGIQHSVMARPGFKRQWTRIIPEPAERSTYVLIASAVLILLFWQWRPMTTTIWSVQSLVGQIVLWSGFGAGFLIVLLSTFMINHFDLFGLRQVWLHMRAQPYKHVGFMARYLYRFVRHPLYLGFLLAFWATPQMTVGHLVFALGMTVYILIGVRYEERDLVHFLGEDYARYREEVPMIIPGLKGYQTTEGTAETE